MIIEKIENNKKGLESDFGLRIVCNKENEPIKAIFDDEFSKELFKTKNMSIQLCRVTKNKLGIEIVYLNKYKQKMYFENIYSLDEFLLGAKKRHERLTTTQKSIIEYYNEQVLRLSVTKTNLEKLTNCKINIDSNKITIDVDGYKLNVTKDDFNPYDFVIPSISPNNLETYSKLGNVCCVLKEYKHLFDDLFVNYRNVCISSFNTYKKRFIADGMRFLFDDNYFKNFEDKTHIDNDRIIKFSKSNSHKIKMTITSDFGKEFEHVFSFEDYIDFSLICNENLVFL